MDIRKGQRASLVQILQNTSLSFEIELSIVGVSVDFFCFGLNANEKLFSDEYMVTPTQPQTLCKAVVLTSEHNEPAIFLCDLSKLPADIEKLSFTASISGQETMQQIQSGHLKFLVDDQEIACFNFDGSDFNSEKSLILGEIYSKNGEWRFNAIAQGFKGGLESLLEHYGCKSNNLQEQTEMTQIEHVVKFTCNIFEHLGEQANLIEDKWASVFQGICNTGADYPHINVEHFNELNLQMNNALRKLRDDLESPTLILATTGTTSSGKSTIVNLLCGADLMPRMRQEMSAGVVYINHSIDGKRHLKIHETQGALWDCGEWHDMADDEIQDRLTRVMDSFNEKKREIHQLATPYIELTYPIACFNDTSLLNLTDIPAKTKFKIMDLPGLRNQHDDKNGDVIKNCRDGLCVVAYDMAQTDESLRIQLVHQVLEQIKQMGGSPARMLFVLNRIDMFNQDRDAERRQHEHITKTQAEITNILNQELPEHKGILNDLVFSRLSSLPAFHVQNLKSGTEKKIHAARELKDSFGKLIPQEISDDLVGNPAKWTEQNFNRVSESVWENSYAGEFFKNLDSHIQTHFPTLVGADSI